VEIRLAFGVAIDHAALGGSLIGSSSRLQELGHGLELHVAVLQLPLVILSSSTAPIRRVIAASFGKMPRHRPGA
jgi:hypothetical protein